MSNFEYRVQVILDALQQCQIALQDLRRDYGKNIVAEDLIRAAYNDLSSATWHVRNLPCVDVY